MLRVRLGVLIIEDEPDHADLLADFLVTRGHVASIARTGGEALELAAHQSFDLVVMDLLLPDIPGPELVSRLRTAGVGCRIIVTTGYQEPAMLRAVIGAGAELVLLKPFRLVDIEQALATSGQPR